MCTITFIPHNNQAFITHNRDESALRATAVPPAIYEAGGYALLYPKDTDAGGTWIAVNENGNTGALMNGGFIKHVHTPPYRKSRGLVLPEIVAAADMLAAYEAIDLEGIEPFTVILYNMVDVLECRWDGKQKHISRHSSGEMHIWSSATLYDAAAIAQRKQWFEEWQQQHPHPRQQNVIGFHLHGGKGNLHNGIRMNRNGSLLTVSCTSIHITAANGIMKYTNLRDNTTSEQAISFIQAPVENQ